MICSNNVSSASSHSCTNVRVPGEQNPAWAPFFKKFSSRFRSAALANPHQAGAAYVNLEMIADWKTVWRSVDFIPCARNVRRANNDLAHDVVTSSMWCWTEKFQDIVTPNIFILSARVIPGITDGRMIEPLFLGFRKTISTVLELFNLRLFSTAQSLMLASSSSLVSTILAGTMRYVSSANFTSTFSGCFVFMSPAFTTYEAGPITDPWTMLAKISRSSDISPL